MLSHSSCCAHCIATDGPYDGTDRGALPPGPIDNTILLKPLTVTVENPLRTGGTPSSTPAYDARKPLSNLKPIKHYRGLNEAVWRELLGVYGGGPEIKRDSLDIYSGIADGK